MVKKRKRKSQLSRPYVAPPKSEPITVERAVEEGLLIARSALTMAVKNHIIVRVLGDNRVFNRLESARFAKLELRRLSREQSNYAARMDQTAATAASVPGASQHQHDYRAADYGPLTQRAAIYTALSTELDQLRDDPEFVAGVVESARSDAWAELGKTVEARLDRIFRPAPGGDYELEREHRMQELREIDLAKLARDFARSRSTTVPRIKR
jgi:hypothetical protein